MHSMSRANVVFSLLSSHDCHSHVFICNGQKNFIDKKLLIREKERGRDAKDDCRGRVTQMLMLATTMLLSCQHIQYMFTWSLIRWDDNNKRQRRRIEENNWYKKTKVFNVFSRTTFTKHPHKHYLISGVHDAWYKMLAFR